MPGNTAPSEGEATVEAMSWAAEEGEIVQGPYWDPTSTVPVSNPVKGSGDNTSPTAVLALIFCLLGTGALCVSAMIHRREVRRERQQDLEDRAARQRHDQQQMEERSITKISPTLSGTDAHRSAPHLYRAPAARYFMCLNHCCGAKKRLKTHARRGQLVPSTTPH